MRFVNMKRSLYVTSEVHLSENDDTTEVRQRQRDSLLPGTSKELHQERKSLSFKDISSAEMFLHYSQCLKLSADNKINAKNAFQLQLIDYMSNMVKSKDNKMENFQVVSSALDASTKIYASRVDRVHMDGLKIAGGLGKMNEKEKQTEAPGEKGIIKFKSSSKTKANSNVVKNVEMLNTSDKGDNRIHPSFLYMKRIFGDCRPGYPVFLTRLNVQDDFNKISFVYSENSTGQENLELSHCSKEFPELPDISRLKTADYVCEPADFIVDELTTNFENFHISPTKYGIDNAIEDLNEQLDMENNFEDQVSASEGFEEVTMDSREQSKDIRCAITCNSSEYSYFDNAKLLLWAGPSYWKAPFPKGNVADVRTKKVKKKQNTVLLFQESLDCKKEFLPGKTTKFLRKTIVKSWLPEKTTYPQDVKFSFTKLQRYFLLGNRGFNCFHTSLWASTSEEDINYDYNNLNDTQEFCANISDVDAENVMNEAIDLKADMLSCDDIQNEDLDQHEDLDLTKSLKLNDSSHTSPSWNLLTPSYKIARTAVPYALAPKKVNMAQLKSSMWTIITDSQKQSPREREKKSGGQEFESQLKFSNIFHKLPTCLPQDIARDLSVSLAFSSLLHLCNENNLVLIGEDDLSDIHIK